MNDPDVIGLLHEHLSCVICDVVTTNSKQCFNGHVHCDACMRKMQVHAPMRGPVCSICRSRRGWARNRIGENISLALNVCFECGIEGCKERVTIDELDDHRLHCEHKKFSCPLGCDCDEMPFLSLLCHLSCHKKVRSLSSCNALNVIVDPSSQVPPLQIFLVHDTILCMRIFFRLDHLDGVNLDIRAGLMARGRKRIGLKVTLFDLCNSLNEYQGVTEVPVIETHESIRDILQLPCFNNFTSENFPTIEAIEQRWSKQTFNKKSPSEMYDSDYELESSRVVAYCIEVVPHEGDFKMRETEESVQAV